MTHPGIIDPRARGGKSTPRGFREYISLYISFFLSFFSFIFGIAPSARCAVEREYFPFQIEERKFFFLFDRTDPDVCMCACVLWRKDRMRGYGFWMVKRSGVRSAIYSWR